MTTQNETDATRADVLDHALTYVLNDNAKRLLAEHVCDLRATVSGLQLALDAERDRCAILVEARIIAPPGGMPANAYDTILRIVADDIRRTAPDANKEG